MGTIDGGLGGAIFAMRKTLVMLLVLFLAVGALAVAGCGGEKAEDGEYESLDEQVSDGIVSTFIEGGNQ